MKKLIALSLIAAFILLVHSCKDITEYGNGNNNIKIVQPVSSEDSLKFLDVPLIDFGDIHWHRIWYDSVIVTNLSDSYTISIYSASFKNNFGFTMRPVKGYPVIIPPKQDNKDNILVAQWDTNLIFVGNWQDTLIFNGVPTLIYIVKGHVNNN